MKPSFKIIAQRVKKHVLWLILPIFAYFCPPPTKNEVIKRKEHTGWLVYAPPKRIGRFGTSRSITMDSVVRPVHPLGSPQKPELLISKVFSMVRFVASELSLDSNYIRYLLLKRSCSDTLTRFFRVYTKLSDHPPSLHINH